MSGEAQIQVSLQITKQDDVGNINHRSYPTQFSANVDGALGPTPGAFVVGIYGTDVDLSQLTTPGLCRITNESSTNFITYGIRDTVDDKFFPLGELKPGEFYLLRLSRYLGWYLPGSGTGTGTLESKVHKLHIIADTDACNVLVEAFEA